MPDIAEWKTGFVPEYGQNPAGASEVVKYGWNDGAMSQVIFQSKPGSGVDVYLKYNDDEDYVGYFPAGTVVKSPIGVPITSVTLKFSGAATLGTDFWITGRR